MGAPGVSEGSRFEIETTAHEGGKHARSEKPSGNKPVEPD